LFFDDGDLAKSAETLSTARKSAVVGFAQHLPDKEQPKIRGFPLRARLSSRPLRPEIADKSQICADTGRSSVGDITSMARCFRGADRGESYAVAAMVRHLATTDQSSTCGSPRAGCAPRQNRDRHHDRA
jgi:hypothetical protein